MSGSVLEVFPDVRERSRDPPECPRVVGRPSQLSESGGRPSWMSWSIRKALANVWEWSVGSLECPGVVGRSSRISRNGREAILNVQEWSGGPPG